MKTNAVIIAETTLIRTHPIEVVNTPDPAPHQDLQIRSLFT